MAGEAHRHRGTGPAPAPVEFLHVPQRLVVEHGRTEIAQAGFGAHQHVGAASGITGRCSATNSCTRS